MLKNLLYFISICEDLLLSRHWGDVFVQYALQQEVSIWFSFTNFLLHSEVTDMNCLLLPSQSGNVIYLMLTILYSIDIAPVVNSQT